MRACRPFRPSAIGVPAVVLATAGCLQGGAWVDGDAAPVAEADAGADVAAVDAPDGVGGGGEVVVSAELGYEHDAPIDLVFVIDHGGSVIEERVVAAALPGFLERLAHGAAVAPRIAATSTDAQCAPDNEHAPASRGTFNTRPAANYPPPNDFAFHARCAHDNDCTAAACLRLGACDDPPGSWACDRHNPNPACDENPNGTINTQCKRLCTTDDECRAALGNSRYICQKLSQNPRDWGCLLPPDTAACAPFMPSFVEGEQLAQAACLTTIARNQERCFRYEEGFEASRLALDPAGPNAAQVAAFRRPDALLVVVYVSNDNDCSAPAPLDEAQYDRCAYLGDTDAGGPLTPVRTYVDALRGLAPAGRVLVLAVTGYSTLSDPDAAAVEEAAFVASVFGPRNCNVMSYLCEEPSGDGVTMWGARYAALAEAFGPEGAVANICTPTQVPEAFARFADVLAAHARRRCLPFSALPGLTVARVHAGAERALTATTDSKMADGYRLVSPAAECPSGVALLPNDRIATGDRIVLRWTSR